MPTYRENDQFIHVPMPDYTIEPASTEHGDGLKLTLVIDGKDYGRTVPDASERSHRALHFFARQAAQHATIDQLKPDASPEDRLACMNWALAYELAVENGASADQATLFANERATA